MSIIHLPAAQCCYNIHKAHVQIIKYTVWIYKHKQ